MSNVEIDALEFKLHRHFVSMVTERRVGQRNVVADARRIRREVIIPLQMSQRQIFADASDRDGGLNDAVDDPREGVERSRQHREQSDGREHLGRRQLVAQQRVHCERDDGYEN